MNRYPDELDRLSFTRAQKEALIERLTEERPEKTRRRPPYRAAVALAAAVSLLVGAAAGASLTRISPEFLAIFGAAEETEIAQLGAVTVNRTFEDRNGLRCFHHRPGDGGRPDPALCPLGLHRPGGGCFDRAAGSLRARPGLRAAGGTTAPPSTSPSTLMKPVSSGSFPASAMPMAPLTLPTTTRPTMCSLSFSPPPSLPILKTPGISAVPASTSW